MGDVVSFPNTFNRNWAEIERNVKTRALKEGIPLAVVEWILSDLKPRIQSVTATVEFALPAEFDPIAHQILASFDLLFNQFVGEMTLLSGELYFAKYGGGAS